MCGIAGFSGHFSQLVLTKMGQAIAHRGPDDHNELLFTTGISNVGLAHRRLSIIDLSAEGQQPMTVHCNKCQPGNKPALWLVYNGELYNYQSLKQELISKGHIFFTKTDSEVLLHLYIEYGKAMLSKLNGIFAFAIYDGRESQPGDFEPGDLFIARDAIGVKPLYYSEMQAGFIFASELKALLSVPELKREVDLTAIHYYLAYLWCPGSKTAMQGVKKLQPGEALIVRQGKVIQKWFYYDLPYNNQRTQHELPDLIAQLDQELSQAIQRQLMSDVPLGAFLSGGLDSSAIVAMMRKFNPDKKINCYTITSKAGMRSEGHIEDLPYAKAVAKHLNVNLNVIHSEANMFQHLEKMIYHLDEPQADPAPLHVYLIAQHAHEQGIKVLLSGAGGDDIFTGYRRHQALQAEHYWQWLPKAAKQRLAYFSEALLSGATKSRFVQHPHVRRLATVGAQMHLSADERIGQHFLWGTESLRRHLYSENMQAYLNTHQTLTPMFQSLARIPEETNKMNRMLYLEGKHFLADHNLNYTDKMAMAVGVEVRVPLLDLNLVQYATQLPVHLKQKGLVGKYLFKKTMETYLPKNIIYRKKTGFGSPLRHWIKHEMADMVHDLLSAKKLQARGIFNPQSVQELIANNHAGKVDAAYTIFSMLCIEIWCQQFIDVKTA